MVQVSMLVLVQALEMVVQSVLSLGMAPVSVLRSRTHLAHYRL
jgi:hypothetical protein